MAVARVREVLIRGDNVMAGYWPTKRPTRAALQDGYLPPAISVTSTRIANLHIVGRLKR